MKKILFFTPSFGGGGSERVVFHIVNNIDLNKYKPVVVAHSKDGWYLEKLKKEIKVYDLKKEKNKLKVILKLFKILNRENPDIVFSTTVQLNALMGFFFPKIFKKIKFILRESIVLSHSSSLKDKAYLKYLLKVAYKNVNLIVAQSDDMMEDMIKSFSIPKSKVIKINNPLDIKSIENSTKENIEIEYEKGYKNILCVGRLVYQKGYDMIIRAMKELKGDKIRLYIIGEGPLEKELKKLIKENKLEEQVILLGSKKNPYPYMKNADLYILSSRFEGFPNALLEANACGRYALVNNCPGGINEIIKEGLNGSIINFNSPKLVSLKITELLSNKYNSDKIKESILSRYCIDKIIREYEKVFNETCKGTN